MNSAAPGSLTDTRMNALVCDLSGVQPSAATIDALARLAVALRRQGSRLRLRHASPELIDLIEFMGLAEVLEGSAEHCSSTGFDARSETADAGNPGNRHYRGD